jgi:hypothetical protein
VPELADELECGWRTRNGREVDEVDGQNAGYRTAGENRDDLADRPMRPINVRAVTVGDREHADQET